MLLGVALPALMGGARGAQLADGARLPGGEEDVGLLAAQQPPLADVAGDIGLGGDDRPRAHQLSSVAARRSVSSWERRRSGRTGERCCAKPANTSTPLEITVG